MRALVRCAAPVKLAAVQPLSKNLVHGTAVELVTPQLDTFPVEFLNHRLYRILTRCKSSEELRDHRSGVRVRDDHPLPTRTVGVAIACRGVAWVHACTCFLRHPLDRLFTQILAVIACHEDFYPVHELF